MIELGEIGGRHCGDPAVAHVVAYLYGVFFVVLW